MLNGRRRTDQYSVYCLEQKIIEPFLNRAKTVARRKENEERGKWASQQKEKHE